MTNNTVDERFAGVNIELFECQCVVCGKITPGRVPKPYLDTPRKLRKDKRSWPRRHKGPDKKYCPGSEQFGEKVAVLEPLHDYVDRMIICPKCHDTHSFGEWFDCWQVGDKLSCPTCAWVSPIEIVRDEQAGTLTADPHTGLRVQPAVAQEG